MKIIAVLTDPASIRSYLEGVGLPARPPQRGSNQLAVPGKPVADLIRKTEHGQHTAFERCSHLSLDVKGQAVLGGSSLLEKALKMFSEDPVEGLLLRMATAVGGSPVLYGGRHDAG
jgi:hypothetical protein